ncbi:protein lifeguard 1-like [Panonychus citri]|uniref:protein lifeguard 1-like n=1 Tax=Panonychus citri TaxID=50023 RepID=UPI002307DE65|nr:protein lifeguard 1-like [Panonychus citri]XP_053203422.1 protein lifeguard 1-like [Panonychus citri]XP_053203423.1 protein lifeguard 1-like [Panonychus citri]
MEASASEVNPSLGSKKKEKRKKGSRPRFEEPTEPGSSKETPYSGDDPRGYGLVDEKPPPYSYEDPRPTAPPLPSTPATDIRLSIPEDPILKSKKLLIRQSYGLLAGQWTLFSGLTLLLVEIPHLRKIIRKNFFDKLFLTSSFGFPLAILMILLMIFPALRRQFAWLTLLILTVSMSLLLAYVVSVESALAMFYTTLGADVSCLGVVGTTFIPRFDISSSSPALLGLPVLMLSSSATVSSLTHIKVSKWLPASSVVTLLMCHLAYNTRSIFKDNRLDLKPNEYAFAASNLYFNCDLVKWIKGRSRRRDYRPIPEI